MAECKFYKAVVSAISYLTPHMVRIVLQGEDLADFQSTNKPDEFVYLVFPPLRQRESVSNTPCSHFDGDGDDEVEAQASGRYYTIRKWDFLRKELVIDFVVHEGGIGSAWAMAAKVGDPLIIRRPVARFNMPAQCDWMCLLADFTGLPALGRIVEEARAIEKIMAHVEIPSFSDRQSIQRETGLHMYWYESFCQDGIATKLVDIAHSIKLPQGTGYIWIAGEALAVANCRKYFRDELGFDKDRITAVGYWIEGQVRD